MNILRNVLFALLLGISFAGIYGCPDSGDGPAEEAGEEIDDAAEDAGDKMEDVGDKAEDAVD
ncbi:MAG: hypothetical protein RIG61_04615 [Deltaproteobacteria bacterium]